MNSLAGFIYELQQLERSPIARHASFILDAFTRHTKFDTGALYLREGNAAELRLAAKSEQCVAPEILEGDAESALRPAPALVVPLQSHREAIGVLALACEGAEAGDDDVQLAHAGAAYLSTLIMNQRLLQETREGGFQLKYRLWELESLYDIGLSIASTLNIDDLADEILFRMISLANARRGGLFLRDANGAFTLYRSFGDVPADLLGADGTPATGDEFATVPIKGSNDTFIGVLAAAERETRDGIAPFEANELRLLSLFANQVAIALENARLHREALEKQAMEREMQLAATIQRDILPKAIPQVDAIEIAALSRPARQVGGDYHAFFLRDGVLSTLVADVAGKSMPAALLVSALHAVLQLLFAEGRELGEIATELNRHIHKWSAENKFVTMIMISIDREAETLQFVNAGHNPAYLISGGHIDTLKSHGLPIGILPGTRYVTQTRPFPAGSTAVLYSDGITEAEDIRGEEFENARLEALLEQHLDGSASLIRDQIAGAVDSFVDEAPQKDDQTLVIVRRTA
ncbi:MAG TPA: SpoIIE family protein phosphatase [Thermoanaerobaculia bacterium]|nr:SpoIIE family protein phosphatase [Thermoanaerobaculia bacterium]